MEAFAIFAMIGLAAFAQQVDKPAGQLTMSWEKFTALSGWDGEPGSFALPWAEAKELLGIEVQGNDTASLRLPWREFKTLLEWRSKQDGVGDSPVPYMIQSCDFVGELGVGHRLVRAIWNARDGSHRRRRSNRSRSASRLLRQ